MDINIRKVKEDDLEQVLELIKELALYEKAPHEVEVTLEQFKNYFNDQLFDAFVAFDGDNLAGIALFYVAYSTWKGKIIYLDDLVITESYRRKGLGDQLFNALVKECNKLKANQLRWHVLDWNTPAINFYKKINADLDPEWIMGKLTREQLLNYFN